MRFLVYDITNCVDKQTRTTTPNGIRLNFRHSIEETVNSKWHICTRASRWHYEIAHYAREIESIWFDLIRLELMLIIMLQSHTQIPLICAGILKCRGLLLFWKLSVARRWWWAHKHMLQNPPTHESHFTQQLNQ